MIRGTTSCIGSGYWSGASVGTGRRKEMSPRLPRKKQSARAGMISGGGKRTEPIGGGTTERIKIR